MGIYLTAKASPHAPYMAHEAAETLLNIYPGPDLFKLALIKINISHCRERIYAFRKNNRKFFLTIPVYCDRLTIVYNYRPRSKCMNQVKLCESDYRFMCVVWENEPVQSGELVKKCLNDLGWKKSTTYTMVKKLSEKGYLKNENSVVSSLISKEDTQSFESGYIVDNAFGGSLPSFIASFVRERNLSDKEIEEIRSIIDRVK